MSGALKRDEWKTVRLGDVCDKVERVSPKSFSEIYYVDISSIDRHSKSVSSPQRIRFETAPASARQLLKKTDILISTVRPNLNAVAIHETDSDIPTIGSTALCVLRCCDTISFRYVFHFTQSDYFIKPLVNVATGACYPTVKNRDVLNVEIPLPPLDIQRRIAETLDKVTELITLRKTQLEKLDELVKARFVEMFGDPVLNPKNWECKTVIDECDCMVPGRDKPKSFTGDIPWITIEDLAVNGVTYESKRGLGLTQEEIDEVNRKTIPKGSVIMSCVGNLGICSIAGKEMIINQQLHSFQCGERINNVFLMNYLGYRKDFMNKWASNTTVLYMNKSICNSIPVIIPPIELQEQFAAFVEQTDKSKVIIQQSLDALETLKKSLMQEYFG